MFLKLNKDLIERDPGRVPKLPNRSWVEQIPGGPEYPPEYFEEDEENSSDQEDEATGQVEAEEQTFQDESSDSSEDED